MYVFAEREVYRDRLSNLVPLHGPTDVCIVRTDCSRRFLGHQLPFLPATRPDITNKRLLVLLSLYSIVSACQAKKMRKNRTPLWQFSRPRCHFGRFGVVFRFLPHHPQRTHPDYSLPILEQESTLYHPHIQYTNHLRQSKLHNKPYPVQNTMQQP
jgi:hypothetical protein